MRELLNELMAAVDQRRPCVFCAVVETRGSTPHKAGAAMLVFPDGSQSGTLGGGCVEADVKQKALRVLNDARGTDLKSVPSGGRAEVLTFSSRRQLRLGRRLDLRRPHEHPRRLGAESGDGRLLPPLSRSIEEGRGCTEAVALAEGHGVTAGSRYLFDARGNLIGQVSDAPVPDDGGPPAYTIGSPAGSPAQGGFAFLPHLPRVTLLIVGGGHVGAAVARLAADVDFEIWVLDDREHFANRERFPSARRLLVGDIGTQLKELRPQLDESTYCLIVTRGHNHDEEALYHLAPTRAGYVGMIGSRRKIKLIFEDLVAKGIAPEALARVHAPLGFDIGSQTVPEIAVSIVAELIACRNLNQSDPRPRHRVTPGTVRP